MQDKRYAPWALLMFAVFAALAISMVLTSEPDKDDSVIRLGTLNGVQHFSVAGRTLTCRTTHLEDGFQINCAWRKEPV